MLLNVDRYTQYNYKISLVTCGTDGRLLLQAKFFQVQSHVTQKIGKTSKIWPDNI